MKKTLAEPARSKAPSTGRLGILALLVFATIHHLISTPLRAATLTVSNINDSGSGSLRQAIQSAASGDTIDFSVTGTITLISGELLVTNNLTFTGPIGVILAINGNTNSRVFDISSNATVNMSDLTIRNGNAGDGPVGGGSGGGLVNRGRLTMTRCTVSGNTAGSSTGSGAGGAGGGIYNLGTLTVTTCTICSNAAGNGGNGGPLGGAGGGGGAIFNAGDAILTACTVVGNRAGNGGAVEFNGNSGGSGGGIYNATNASFAKLRNTLIALNAVGMGGHSPHGGSGPSGTGPNLSGSFSSQGHNLIGLTNGSSGIAIGVNNDLVGLLDPMLGPLQNNGGPTFTMALLADSPALDAGDDTLLSSPFNLVTDQRGYARKSGAHVDIGAFESQIPATPPYMVSLTNLGNGAFGFVFTSTPGASFTVLATTNLSLPSSDWAVLGVAIEVSPGQFQFADTEATNNPRRYYQLRSP